MRISDWSSDVCSSDLLRSDWGSHALNLHADSTHVRYTTHDSENYNDYTLATDGRLDVLRDLQLFGGAGYQVRPDPRSSPDTKGADGPTAYSAAPAPPTIEKASTQIARAACRDRWSKYV